MIITNVSKGDSAIQNVLEELDKICDRKTELIRIEGLCIDYTFNQYKIQFTFADKTSYYNSFLELVLFERKPGISFDQISIENSIQIAPKKLSRYLIFNLDRIRD